MTRYTILTSWSWAVQGSRPKRQKGRNIVEYGDDVKETDCYAAGKGNREEKAAIGKPFAKYASRSILGLLGMACYYLADTFFVAKSQGADGLAALNIASPPYYLIYAVGAMLANGSAILYKIHQTHDKERTKGYFSDTVMFCLLFSIPFMLIGIICPSSLMALMGGEGAVGELGTKYLRIILLFSPLFMWSYVVTSYVRNDGEPSLAMTATLMSSLFNIVGDYILMFPLQMGLTGAALATGLSPVVSIMICFTHFFKKSNTIHLLWKMPDFRFMFRVLGIGWADFATEASVAIVVLVYNFLILGISGNTGAAAYGVISNVAIFVKSIFKGMAEGTQPLISDAYGKGRKGELGFLFRIERITATLSAVITYGVMFLLADRIAALFNNDGSEILQELTVSGIRLYFAAYLFGAFNIVCTGYFSATENAFWAAVVSVLRGFLAIIVLAVLMAGLFGMNGVWLSQAAAEIFTFVFVLIGLNRVKRKGMFRYVSK